MLKEFWAIVQAVGSWTGTAITRDRRGVCLTLDGVKLGHLDWDGWLVLPFEAEMRNQIVAEKLAHRDPGQPDTGHAILNIRTADDVDRALWLLRIAYLIQDAKQGACTSVATLEPVIAL
jgi:hypothetical protein